jgi:hypothetical protein
LLARLPVKTRVSFVGVPGKLSSTRKVGVPFAGITRGVEPLSTSDKRYGLSPLKQTISPDPQEPVFVCEPSIAIISALANYAIVKRMTVTNRKLNMA